MKKTITKILGITVKEVTTYEDEKEMPAQISSGDGVVLELTEKEMKQLEEQK